MCIELKVRTWRRAAKQASAIVVLVGCCSHLPGQAGISAAVRAGAAQSAGADPCRFVSDVEIGKAFGRPLKGSKLAEVCQYKGTGTDVVVVSVRTGPEGTILRHLRTASAQGQKGAERVTTTVGEAYFDSILPAFAARVGDYDVQIETTIEPVPRDAMIAVGNIVLGTLARR